jgi:hypothetical protein
MGQRIRISAKVLAEVAMAGFCPRCFWIKQRVPKQLPYQSFPGIFSSIDSYSKQVVHSWFDKGLGPPDWLFGLGELVAYKTPPHYSKFNILDEENDILLTGSPDGVFVRPDNSHVIVDYKTSRYTPHQERLYALYEAQLNAYALIGESCGLAPVTGLALIYTEPVTDGVSAAEGDVRREDGFAMGFVANIVDVKLNPSMIQPLLAKTREICDLPASPGGRRGCRNCGLLDDLLDVVAD